MKILHITVLDKKAIYRERDGDIVCGNSDYAIEFTFDSDWEGQTTKTARFSYGGRYQDVVFVGNTVSVPILKNATSVKVGVFAGNLSTTSPATIPCVKSILCDDDVPEPPSNDVYNQIIALIASSGDSKNTEDWTFTLEDGSIVTKKVVVA